MAFFAIFDLCLTPHFIVLLKTLHFLRRNLLEKSNNNIIAKLVFNVESNMSRGASHIKDKTFCWQGQHFAIWIS